MLALHDFGGWGDRPYQGLDLEALQGKGLPEAMFSMSSEEAKAIAEACDPQELAKAGREVVAMSRQLSQELRRQIDQLNYSTDDLRQVSGSGDHRL